jgi:MFS family permease
LRLWYIIYFILGGYIINLRGGYENPKTVYLVFIFASVGLGCAVIIPFINGFYVAVILLWIVLFFGGAMMPGLTGIMMVSVPPYLRAFGNSNGEIIKNIFGYLPAPFMYGWFNSMFGERAGIKLLMFWGLLAPFLLAIGSFHRYRQLKRASISELG